MAEEKTEKPTEKKKKESRKEGQVARTPDLGGWAILLAFALALGPLGSRFVDDTTRSMVESFRELAAAEQADAIAILGEGLMLSMKTVLLIGAGALLIGVAATVAQGGFFIASKQATPSFQKISLFQGVKRLFSLLTLWEGIKAVVKSVVVGIIVWQFGKELTPLLTGVAEPTAVVQALAQTTTQMLMVVALAGILMAGADYAFQARRTGKQVRMTKQEVKDENKNSEGDPLIRSAIRSRQMAVARNRMIADVSSADAVLINPVHVAVALKYDPQHGAPKVVAKGTAKVAEKIREAAEKAEVPLVEDVPLARALYSSCNVGQEIPVELFSAVATVLAFVVSRRKRGMRLGRIGTPRTTSDLPEIKTRRLFQIRETDPDPAEAEGSTAA